MLLAMPCMWPVRAEADNHCASKKEARSVDACCSGDCCLVSADQSTQPAARAAEQVAVAGPAWIVARADAGALGEFESASYASMPRARDPAQSRAFLQTYLI